MIVFLFRILLSVFNYNKICKVETQEKQIYIYIQKEKERGRKEKTNKNVVKENRIFICRRKSFRFALN